MSSFLFERDILYPTDNILDPGSLHVKILRPENSKIPVVVEPKSSHSAVENVKVILDILQKDIFDRINIKININTSIYLLLIDSDKVAYGDAKYLNVVFKGVNEFVLEPVNAVI